MSFGAKKEDAEDITQNMYLKVNTLINSGLDITFDDDINKFYIYRTLKSLFYDKCRKEAKIQKPKKLTNLFKYFFGEDQARYLVEIDGQNLTKAEEVLKDNNIYYNNVCFLLDTINSLPVEEKFSLLNGDYTFYSLIRGTFHKLKKASEKDRDVTETEDYWLTVKEFEKVVNKILK